MTEEQKQIIEVESAVTSQVFMGIVDQYVQVILSHSNTDPLAVEPGRVVEQAVSLARNLFSKTEEGIGMEMLDLLSGKISAEIVEEVRGEMHDQN